MKKKQLTLAKSIKAEGIGLHTGKVATIEFVPAPVNTGFIFIRTDIVGEPQVCATLENVIGTNRGTILREGEVEVHTVEHVLSALSGCEITNLYIRLSNVEPPALDGSAWNYVELIEKAGFIEQDEEVEICRLNHTLSLSDNEKSIVYLPSEDFEVTFSLAYKNDIIPPTRIHVIVDADLYRNRICKARTFGFEHEFDMLKANNLALGGSLDNAILINNHGEVVNSESLRDEDELALHKILDLVGDFALIGMPVKGHIVARFTGHNFNTRFAKMLKSKFIESRHEKDLNMMYIEQIKEILPHRYPFLLVDRIVSIDPGKSIVGYKNVTTNEEFFNGHYPGRAVMPGVLIVEAMAQVAGVLFLSQPENKGKTPYFCGIDRIRFRRPVVPGDRLEFHVKVLKVRGSTGKVEAEVRVDGELVTGGELLFQLL